MFLRTLTSSLPSYKLNRIPAVAVVLNEPLSERKFRLRNFECLTKPSTQFRTHPSLDRYALSSFALHALCERNLFDYEALLH